MNIYLDIDGVILANDKAPALHVEEFVEHIVTNFPVYWLTTHVRHPGDDPLPMLARFLDGKTIELLKQVKPTQWDTFKTEAIDFSQEFRWFDDDVFEEEKRVLRENGVFDSWVEVDLADDQDFLAKAIT